MLIPQLFHIPAESMFALPEIGTPMFVDYFLTESFNKTERIATVHALRNIIFCYFFYALRFFNLLNFQYTLRKKLNSLPFGSHLLPRKIYCLRPFFCKIHNDWRELSPLARTKDSDAKCIDFSDLPVLISVCN